MEEIDYEKEGHKFWDRMIYSDHEGSVSRVDDLHRFYTENKLTDDEYGMAICGAIHQIREFEDLTDDQVTSLVESAANTTPEGCIALLSFFRKYRDNNYGPFDFFGNHFSVEEQMRRKPFIFRTSDLLISLLSQQKGEKKA